jgi:hypothetical protein
LAFAVFVFVGFVGGDGKVGDRLASAGEASLRVAAEAADENYFVHRHFLAVPPCGGDDSRNVVEEQKSGGAKAT